MSTVVLNAYSKAYPTITNRIRAAVYLQSSPNAIVASIIDDTSGHPERTWSFPGLVRSNYKFTLDVIDEFGDPISNLAAFDVVPGEQDGALVRSDEQIRVGETPGFNAGATSFVFDGTIDEESGLAKPDYIGWDIVPSELTGRGILVRGLDYSWDMTTGTFTLLQAGDEFYFATYYNIHFNDNAIGTEVGGEETPPTTVSHDIQAVYISNTGQSLTADMFGKRLIIEPTLPYTSYLLPVITSVVAGRELHVEVDASFTCCVEFSAVNGQTIKFLRGKLYVMAKESFVIYRFDRPNANPEWRVCKESGNFKECGNMISHDQLTSGLFNVQLCDGSSVPVTSHARLYNEVVLRLPVGQAVNYDDWPTTANQSKFSLAKNGEFRVPARLGLFERNNIPASFSAGFLQTESVGAHTHGIDYILEGNDGNPTASGQVLKKDASDGNGTGQGGSGTNLFAIKANTSAGGNWPNNVFINRYILL